MDLALNHNHLSEMGAQKRIIVCEIRAKCHRLKLFTLASIWSEGLGETSQTLGQTDE